MKAFIHRWKVALIFMGIVYFLAIFGVWVAIFIPFVGGPLFIAGLMIWYVPGLLFHWTGYFVWHEFGAAPNGWQGHVIMFVFYLGIAVVVSMLLRRIFKKLRL